MSRWSLLVVFLGPLFLVACEAVDGVAILTASEDVEMGGQDPMKPIPEGLALDAVEALWAARSLCTCQDLQASDAVEVWGLGVDLDLSVSGALLLRGGATVAGEVRLGSSDALVETSLAVGASWSGSGGLRVEGDAAIGGRVQAGRLEVTGTLRQPPGAARDTSEPPVLGRLEEGAVAVEAPCQCDELPDLAVWLETLAPRRGQVVESPETLGAGVHVFERDERSADLVFSVLAPAVLVVRERLVAASLTFELAPSAALTVVVGGDLVVQDRLRASASSTVSVQLLVASDGTVRLPPRMDGFFQLYAPNAEMSAPAGVDAQGSWIVKRVATSGPLRVRP